MLHGREEKATVMKWNGMKCDINVEASTLFEHIFFRFRFIRYDVPHWAKQFLWWMCLRELISFFPAFGLFLFLFVSFFFLFCTSIYFRSTLLFACLISKGFFLYFPLSFLFQLITCIAQKNYDVFYGMFFLSFFLSFAMCRYFQPKESRINLK